MSALYAFCREVDDIADADGEAMESRRARLGEWKVDIERACKLGRAELAVNRELVPHIARYGLALEHFQELIRGVEMDLDTQRYASYAMLDQYCYRVASVVGLLSIQVFGYRNPACREYAVLLGKALQYTNILRDVGTDAARGRVYLPREALEEYSVSEEEILQGVPSERFTSLAGAFAARARAYFRQAQEALPAEDRRSMVAAEVMGAVYWRLLKRLESLGYPVLSGPVVRLSRSLKMYLIWRTWLRVVLGSQAPNYGV